MTSDPRSLIEATELPKHEATRLLATATGMSRSELLLSTVVDSDAITRFQGLVNRRRAGEPLQYIEEEVPFADAMLSVDPSVLIPRPETEELVGLIATITPPPQRIVDLCTGSGNLAIALALQYPESAVVATEISPAAAAVARANAAANSVDVVVLEGDLFEPLPDHMAGTVDLMAANPPYVTESEYALLEADVRAEPRGALVSGPTGLEVIERIADQAVSWLAPGGVIVCEIGSSQGDAAMRLFADLQPELHIDMYGRERAVVGRMPVE